MKGIGVNDDGPPVMPGLIKSLKISPSASRENELGA
jgi:hypothetical protein